MKIHTSYSVKIKRYNKIFKDTVALSRKAVDFLIAMILKEWELFKDCHSNMDVCRVAEALCVISKVRAGNGVAGYRG